MSNTKLLKGIIIVATGLFVLSVGFPVLAQEPCEGDFDCDQDVDASDVTGFLDDFGREQYWNPCTDNNPCNGDFDCDADVDANDTTTFLEDFGREPYYNPCPACVPGNECDYYDCTPPDGYCGTSLECCDGCCYGGVCSPPWMCD